MTPHSAGQRRLGGKRYMYSIQLIENVPYALPVQNALPKAKKRAAESRIRQFGAMKASRPHRLLATLREELLASHQLLRNHASHGDHGKAAIVQLFRLHRHELLLILGLEAKRIETKVSWLVV